MTDPFQSFEDQALSADASPALELAKQAARAENPAFYDANRDQIDQLLGSLFPEQLNPVAIRVIMHAVRGTQVDAEREQAARAALDKVGMAPVLDDPDLDPQVKRRLETAHVDEAVFSEFLSRSYPNRSPRDARKLWLEAAKSDAAKAAAKKGE